MSFQINFETENDVEWKKRMSWMYHVTKTESFQISCTSKGGVCWFVQKDSDSSFSISELSSPGYGQPNSLLLELFITFEIK